MGREREKQRQPLVLAHIVGSMVKMISLDDNEAPIWKVFTKPQWSTYVCRLFHVYSILKSFKMLFSNNECWSFEFCLFLMKNGMSPPTCIIIPLHAKVSQRFWIQPQHHHMVVCHWVMIVASCHSLDVEANECIEHVSDKEEGMEDNRVVTKLLCMVPHSPHWRCSLLCGYRYVWVISSCTSIYVQKH